jgi:uncharacterized repeat protein (TIGR01451 family)
VFVGGTLVGTNAISAGREDFGGTVDVTQMPGYNLFWRPTSVSFASNALEALVYVGGTERGPVVYAIIKSCGNPVRVTPTAVPSQLATEKLERNVTKSETNWVKQTQANPGDILEYQINYSTAGSNNNVLIYDALGEPVNHMNRRYLDYISGGQYYSSGYVTPSGYTAPRMVVFPLGNLGPGSQGHVNFTVKVKSSTPANTTICNSAAIRSDQVSPIISNDVCVNIIVVPPTPVRQFTMNKLVSKVDHVSWVKNITTTPNTEAYFRIDFRNTGNTNLTNVVAKDTLPPHTTFVPGSTTLQKTGQSKVSVKDGISSSGVNIGSFTPGAQGIIIFKVKLDSSFPRGITNLTNTACVHPSGMANKCSTAKIVVDVRVTEIVQSKSAFNETQGVDAQTVKAKPGDVIRYTLTTRNTGNAPENNYIVQDSLSDVVTYSNVTDLGGGTLGSDKIIRYPAQDINPDQVVTKTFKVTIKPASEWPAGGSFTMTNVYGNLVVVPVVPPTPGVIPASAVKGLVATGTVLNIVFGTFIFLSSIYLYFRQKILLRLAVLSI